MPAVCKHFAGLEKQQHKRLAKAKAEYEQQQRKKQRQDPQGAQQRLVALLCRGRPSNWQEVVVKRHMQEARRNTELVQQAQHMQQLFLQQQAQAGTAAAGAELSWSSEDPQQQQQQQWDEGAGLPACDWDAAQFASACDDDTYAAAAAGADTCDLGAHQWLPQQQQQQGWDQGHGTVARGPFTEQIDLTWSDCGDDGEPCKHPHKHWAGCGAAEVIELLED